jgi:nicotinamidase-related amidase
VDSVRVIYILNRFRAVFLSDYVKKCVVYGIAIEYCVKIVVMGLLKRGMKTAVVTDEFKAINENDGKAATEAMTAAGVELVTVKDIINTK